MISTITQTKSTWRESPPVLARQDCTICHGTGWVLLPAGGAPGARRCACGTLYKLLRLKECACIPQRYEHCSLGNFTPVTSSQARALARAQRFVDLYPKVRRGLFFVGGSGAGKSHLAVGIVRELLQRFHDDVRFIDCDTLAHAATGGGAGFEVDWERLGKVELLVLDNLAGITEAERIRPIQALIQNRLTRKRLTIYTGTSVHWEETLPFRPSSCGFSSQRFLPGWPPLLITQILKSVRTLPVNGPDIGRRDSGRTGLF